jgi:hypothetical protein
MEVIENAAYLRLCLFYKGDVTESELVVEKSSSSGDAIAYGVANWHLAVGDTENGKAMLEVIFDGDNWAAFGHIAAEADLARSRSAEFGIRN